MVSLAAIDNFLDNHDSSMPTEMTNVSVSLICGNLYLGSCQNGEDVKLLEGLDIGTVIAYTTDAEMVNYAKLQGLYAKMGIAMVTCLMGSDTCPGLTPSLMAKEFKLAYETIDKCILSGTKILITEKAEVTEATKTSTKSNSVSSILVMYYLLRHLYDSQLVPSKEAPDVLFLKVYRYCKIKRYVTPNLKYLALLRLWAMAHHEKSKIEPLSLPLPLSLV